MAEQSCKPALCYPTAHHAAGPKRKELLTSTRFANPNSKNTNLTFSSMSASLHEIYFLLEQAESSTGSIWASKGLLCSQLVSLYSTWKRKVVTLMKFTNNSNLRGCCH